MKKILALAMLVGLMSVVGCGDEIDCGDATMDKNGECPDATPAT